MKRRVSDDLWLILHQTGVRRCYGIAGVALNPAFEAIDWDPVIEFIRGLWKLVRWKAGALEGRPGKPSGAGSSSAVPSLGAT